MAKPIIAPSFLSADFGNLDKDIALIESSNADWLHLDIMDGLFVPNISFGMPLVEHIAKKSKKTIDAHLMIVKPERYVSRFAECGVHYLTVHFEASTHLHRTVQSIKQNGMKAGVALNPHTPVQVLEDIAGELDLVLLMSVNPGFGGQSFIENSYRKLEKLVSLRKDSGSGFLIEIDGGVNEITGKELVRLGADVLVAGNYVFKSADPLKSIDLLMNM